jgi:hypothetical protein
MGTARDGDTATSLPDGKVLVVGGTGSAGYLASAETYDPASGAWSATGRMAAARVAHTATRHGLSRVPCSSLSTASTKKTPRSSTGRSARRVGLSARSAGSWRARDTDLAVAGSGLLLPCARSAEVRRGGLEPPTRCLEGSRSVLTELPARDLPRRSRQ